jgi:hypothetical protein
MWWRSKEVVLYGALLPGWIRQIKPYILNPGGEYLLIFNMGDGTGILHKKWLTLGGRLAFIIKDYIDRKFMKKFQSFE